MLMITKEPAKPKIDPVDEADRELLRKAKSGDSDAANQLIVDLQPLIKKIASKSKSKYYWIDEEDLQQSLSLTVYRHIKRFDLEQQGNSWKKYEYFRLHGEAKQWLRELDPIGVSNPHRKQYPAYCHFSQVPDTGKGQTSWYIHEEEHVPCNAELNDLYNYTKDNVVSIELECLYLWMVVGWSRVRLIREFTELVVNEEIARAETITKAIEAADKKNDSDLLTDWICQALREVNNG